MNTNWHAKIRFIGVKVILVALLGTMTVGCTTPGMTEDKTRAVRSLKELEERISKADAQVNETIAAAESLTNTADLLAAYKTLVSELDETRDMQKSAAKRRADMSVNSEAYIASWKQQATMLSDQGLRDAATLRAKAVADRFEAVREKADQAKAAYDPFISKLDDLEAYLQNDLTSAGVKAAESVIKDVATSGKALKDAIKAYDEELKKTIKAISAGPTNDVKPKE